MSEEQIPLAEAKIQKSKPQPNLFTATEMIWNNHRNKFAIIVVFLALATMIISITHFENRFDYHLSLIKNGHHMVSGEKVSDHIMISQVDGIPSVFNAKDDLTELQRQLFTKWAKKQGFDGIVFGRIQTGFDGKIKFASSAGENAIPIELVTQQLLDNNCKNVLSVMSNKSNFWLPHPFTYQVDGELKVYETKAINAAGLFSVRDPKIKFKADNLKATLNLEDKDLKVKLKGFEPWELPVQEEAKKH